MMNTLRKFIPKPYQHFLQANMRAVTSYSTIARGFLRNQNWQLGAGNLGADDSSNVRVSADSSNPLQLYFDSHTEGRGIWKWKHYFEIYHRHFQKFIGQEVHILEIGVYSGGSLDMWKSYFGPKSRIYGVDIEEACKEYEDDSVKIFIGDQSDRNFWKLFKEEVPAIDIIIDDGGHETHQQIVTLEEMLPHLRPGGVYLCEDVGGSFNRFASYISGFTWNLNALNEAKADTDENGRFRFTSIPTQFQASVHSVHLYPFVTVIEKNELPMDELVAPKHGTQWQPFKFK